MAQDSRPDSARSAPWAYPLTDQDAGLRFYTDDAGFPGCRTDVLVAQIGTRWIEVSRPARR